MIICREYCWFLLLQCFFLFSGHSTHALSHNYYATTECLVQPEKVDYGGGLIVNYEFESLEGWNVLGEAKIKQGISKDGNRFIVAYNRTTPTDTFFQEVQVEKGNHYSFAAWVQVSEGSGIVSVMFKRTGSEHDMIYGGKVMAKHGCWTLLKGGVTANFSAPVRVLFVSKETSREMWVDNVSLQPFTKEKWRCHQEKSINKVRKNKVRFQVTDSNKSALQGAGISIRQTKSNFPFGCAMNYNILNNKGYQNWFVSRFKFTTFTNEMKWYSTEKIQGQENYTIPDAMLKFCKENGISIRGHNIFWDNPKYQPDWVKSLNPEELRAAAENRIVSVVSRYRGQLIAWDVVNENLHFSFFEDKLGRNASAMYFSKAYELDPNTTLFINEYNTIENNRDKAATPENYKKKLEDILSFPGNDRLSAGIGLQGGSFGSSQPNLAYMRASLDILGTTGLPIWLTEVSVANGANQAEYLEEILREAYSHPAVQGIISFSGPEQAGFKVMPLADENFKNTAAGDVVDKLLKEWKSTDLEITTDSNGLVDIPLFHGDYSVLVQHDITNYSTSLNISVTKDVPKETILVKIHA